MLKQSYYPKINILSKNELAKHVTQKNFPYSEALNLINDVLNNFDKYWHDNSYESEPEKNKFVRSASRTPLGDLLGRIDRAVLAPHDCSLPDFIFGGVRGKNHIQAAHSLLGLKRNRVLLGLDIKGFFEKISEERVSSFFRKCGCSTIAAKLLAKICCVPTGIKGSGNENRSIARGFATSPRLSVWCNLGIFKKIDWKIRQRLKEHDPKLAIYVDDIGISASGVSIERMEKISKIVETILLKSDRNQELPINISKKKNFLFVDGVEHLGLKLGRRKVSPGWKTRSRKDKVLNALRQTQTKSERDRLLKRKKSYNRYEKQVSNI